MKTAWILLFAATTNQCTKVSLETKVRAYETELQCNQAMRDYAGAAQNSGGTVIHKQCQSVDSMLEEQKLDQLKKREGQ